MNKSTDADLDAVGMQRVRKKRNTDNEARRRGPSFAGDLTAKCPQCSTTAHEHFCGTDAPGCAKDAPKRFVQRFLNI